jgi:hypothetical protein
VISIFAIWGVPHAPRPNHLDFGRNRVLSALIAATGRKSFFFGRADFLNCQFFENVKNSPHLLATFSAVKVIYNIYDKTGWATL